MRFCHYVILFLWSARVSADLSPLILDHDGNVDDFAALTLVLSSSRFELRAVTIVPGDSLKDPATEVTKRFLGYLGAKNVAIAASDLSGTHPFPDSWRRDSIKIGLLPILAQVTGDPSNSVSSQSAPEFLARVLSQSDEKFSILATGPLSNIAEAFRMRPSIREKVARIYIMGGALRVPGNVHDPGHDGSAEWNFYNNPKAAEAVIASGVPITLVSLDATNSVPLTFSFIQTLRQHGATNASRLMVQTLEVAAPYIKKNEYYFWDTLTALSVIKPSLVKTSPMKVKVITSGPSQGRIIESKDGHWIDVVQKLDRKAVEAAVLELLNPKR